jgi:hypothetical protein
LKHGTKCVFDISKDLRRRIGQKRRIEILEEERDTLLQIVDTLRGDHSNNVNQLLYLIRSQATLDDIKTYISSKIPKHVLENQKKGWKWKSSTQPLSCLLSRKEVCTPNCDYIEHIIITDYCYSISYAKESSGVTS